MEKTGMSYADKKSALTQRRVFRHKRIWWSIGIIVTLILSILFAFNFSPWPGVLVIRYLFDANAASVKKELATYTPQGVSVITDQQYRSGDHDARLDVYFPDTADQPGMRLPAVIWTHGGAWISGYKDSAAPYFQLIAIEGYSVISLDYSLAPGKTYPTPVYQVNDALAYIQQNADRFHVDVNRIVMAGDSAGAQITSQIAALITNPAYAAELGLTPSIKPEQLRGVILHCGIYDMATFIEHAQLAPSRLLRWGTETVVWAYTGSQDYDSTKLQQMSTINHITRDFPPTFISGGNHDPLTNDQSKPLTAKLKGLGVDVWTLFYPEDHKPALGHEFQFKLDNTDGQNALRQTLAFLKRHTSP
jgi:acetyl esterase/lipase